MNCRFQDAWVVKLLWVESIAGVDEKMHKMKCKICNKIEIRCNKVLIAN